MSQPNRLLLRFALTVALLLAMNRWMSEMFFVGGGWTGVVAVAALVTLLNVLVRPLLDLVTLPLKLLTGGIVVMAVNLVILLALETVTRLYDPHIATLTLEGGLRGWLLAAIVLGTANWVMKETL
ncbi:MAG: hypothetical protein G01um101425_432 [Candidatus Peregrinibacteria bacterium Gr01-1014_25]|nr:MAG: hypothetical protein G01um101425_432 [Candidatus Peregrinibacteria bacterium Gr01-1014_25]